MPTYSLNIPQIITNTIPYAKRKPLLTAYNTALASGMTWLNRNLGEYVYGATYAYYNASATYSLGDRVIGGPNFNNYVYEVINTTIVNPGAVGTIVGSTISTYRGYGFTIGDNIVVNGPFNSSIGHVTSATNPTGLVLTVNVSAGVITTTSPVTAGTGYSVGTQFYVNGGFSLAKFQVTSVGTDGNILGYMQLYNGSGYVAGTHSTTVLPQFTGNVLDYVLTSSGYGYSLGTASVSDTTNPSATPFVINITSLTGFPNPNSSLNWQVVDINFIGVKERDLYDSTKLTLEWSLNRYFDTTFRQPHGVSSSTTHSDIYIQDDTYGYGTFHSGRNNNQSSFSLRTNSSDWATRGGYSQLTLGLGAYQFAYNILVPNNVLTILPGGSQSIKNYVSKYNVYSVPYNIIGY